jgi:hypothetical protein
MTAVQRMISPPYLQFFISGSEDFEAPMPTEQRRVLSNGVGLSIPCQYLYEGDTELIIGDYADVRRSEEPQFDGVIPTPNRVLIVSDVELTEWLRYPVPTAGTRLTVWTDQEFATQVVVAVA